MAADLPVIDLLGALIDVPKVDKAYFMTDAGIFILAIFLSPLAVALKIGFKAHFFINLAAFFLCPIILNIPHAWVVIAITNVLRQHAKMKNIVPDVPIGNIPMTIPREDLPQLPHQSQQSSGHNSVETERTPTVLQHESLSDNLQSIEEGTAAAQPLTTRSSTPTPGKISRVPSILDTVFEQDESASLKSNSRADTRIAEILEPIELDAEKMHETSSVESTPMLEADSNRVADVLSHEDEGPHNVAREQDGLIDAPLTIRGEPDRFEKYAEELEVLPPATELSLAEDQLAAPDAPPVIDSPVNQSLSTEPNANVQADQKEPGSNTDDVVDMGPSESTEVPEGDDNVENIKEPTPETQVKPLPVEILEVYAPLETDAAFPKPNVEDEDIPAASPHVTFEDEVGFQSSPFSAEQIPVLVEALGSHSPSLRGEDSPTRILTNTPEKLISDIEMDTQATEIQSTDTSSTTLPLERQGTVPPPSTPAVTSIRSEDYALQDPESERSSPSVSLAAEANTDSKQKIDSRDLNFTTLSEPEKQQDTLSVAEGLASRNSQSPIPNEEEPLPVELDQSEDQPTKLQRIVDPSSVPLPPSRATTLTENADAT